MNLQRGWVSLLFAVACVAVSSPAAAQENAGSAVGFSVGLAFGITSVEDFGVSNGGLGLLGRVRWGRFDFEFAAHHLGSNPSRTNVDAEGVFRTEVLLGSRHLLASYRLRFGTVVVRPGIGVAWYTIEYGPDRGSIERVSQKDAAVALSIGVPVIRRSEWQLALELAGRTKLPLGQDSTEPRNVLAAQIVVSIPGR